MKKILGIAGALAMSAGLGGCGEDDGPHEADLGCGGQAAYANFGPHPVGVTTLSLDGVDVEVWYPAAAPGRVRDTYDLRDWLGDAIQQQIPDEDAPTLETRAYRDTLVRDGVFPLVVFSHGLGGYRSQSTFFTTHVASWGFIVAAPDHPERGLRLLVDPGVPVTERAPQTLLDTVELLAAASADPDGRFFGRIDATKVAATGHSAGGAAASVAAADPAIMTWIGHAGASDAERDKPALIMAGETDDTVTPGRLSATYSALAGGPQQRYISIFGAGHLAFSDICLIGREQGGLVPLAQAYGVEIPDLFAALATDGCEVGDLPPERAWPVINHYSTAHLFEVLDVAGARPGFGPDARACFDPLVLEQR